LLSIGAERETAWGVVEAAALDSIPALRRKVMMTLLDANNSMTTAEAAQAIAYPRGTTERTLDDLVAHGIAEVERPGSGKANIWRASEWTLSTWGDATSPAKSQVPANPGETTSRAKSHRQAEPTSPANSHTVVRGQGAMKNCTHIEEIAGEVRPLPEDSSSQPSPGVKSRNE
jgi:hypothetical protein